LKYDIPTADSLIAGIVENVRHILTDDEHFDATKGLIKPIDLKAAMRLGLDIGNIIHNPNFMRLLQLLVVSKCAIYYHNNLNPFFDFNTHNIEQFTSNSM